MQFKYKLSAVVVALFLSACSNPTSTTTSNKVDFTQKYAKNISYLKTSEDMINNVKPFELNEDGQISKAYLVGNSLRAVKTSASTVYFDGAKNYSVVNNGNVFTFVNNKLTKSFALSNGKAVNDATGAFDAKNLAHKLFAKFSLNKADKIVPERESMPAQAKLNYLCSEKVKQVKATKRFFRSGLNTSLEKTQNLVAEVRLNGSQFYNMDCKINLDKIQSLSLHKK